MNKLSFEEWKKQVDKRNLQSIWPGIDYCYFYDGGYSPVETLEEALDCNELLSLYEES